MKTQDLSLSALLCTLVIINLAYQILMNTFC